MPYVTCPTCGERGKIPSSLIGQRIKCRKCGLGFQVSPPAAKAGGPGAGGVAGAAPSATAGAAATAAATTDPSAAVEVQGIEVEGLDASSWSLPAEAAMVLKEAGHHAELGHESSSPSASSSSASFAPVAAIPAEAREYKLLTSRDKAFEGKFDLARLEEALNLYARQGWVAKAMSTPHLKNFSGVLEEVIVVLLERSKEPA